MELSKMTMLYIVAMLFMSATASSIGTVSFEESMIDDKDVKLTLYQIAKQYTNTSSDQIQKRFNFSQSIVEYLNSTQFLQIASCMDLRTTDSLEHIFRTIRNAAASPVKAIQEFLSRLGQEAAAREFYNFVITNYNKTFIHYCNDYHSLLYTKGYKTFLVQYQAGAMGVTVDELNIFSERLKCTNRLVSSAVSKWTGWQEEKAANDVHSCVMEMFSNMTDLSAAAKLTKTQNDVKKMNIIDISTKYWNVSAAYLKGVGKLARWPREMTNVLRELSLNTLEIALNTTINGTKISSVVHQIGMKGEKVKKVRETPLIVTLAAIGVHGVSSTSPMTIVDVILKYTQTSEVFLTSWFNVSSNELSHMKKYPLGKFLIVNFPELQIIRLLHINTYTLADPHTIVGAMDEIKENLEKEYRIGIRYMMEKIRISDMKGIYRIPDLSFASEPFGRIISMKNGLNDLGTNLDANGMTGVIEHVALEMMNTLTLMELVNIDYNSNDAMTIKEFSKSLILAAKEIRLRHVFAKSVLYMINAYSRMIRQSPQAQPDVKSFISFEVGVPVDQIQFGDFKTVFMSVANENKFQVYARLVEKVSDYKLANMLTVKELLTLSAFPDAVVLVEKFSYAIAKVNLTLAEIKNNTQITYGVLLMRLGITSIERVKLIMTNLMSDTKFADMIVDKAINETLSIVSSDVTTLTLLNMLSIHSMDNQTDIFMPFKILKYRCRQYNFGLDSDFNSIRETCFKNNNNLRILNNKLVGQLTLRDFSALVAGIPMYADVMGQNYPTIVSIMTQSYEKFQAVANMPLILAAQSVGIAFNELKTNNIITTTLLIFRKHGPVTEQIVAKMFQITPAIMTAAKTATLLIMQQLAKVDNIQKMYLSSLNIIFQIAGGSRTADEAINKDMPSIVNKLCELTIKDLLLTYQPQSYVPKANDPFTLGSTLPVLFLTLFGMDDKLIEETFLIPSEDTSLLRRRKIGDIVYLHSLSSKRFDRDVMQYSPLSLVSFIIGFSTYQMQDLLVSKPSDSGLKFDKVKKFIDANTFGVTLSDLEAFVKRYYPGGVLNVTGDDIFKGFLDGDLTILSRKFDVDVRGTQWMKIITYVKKDLQFEKFARLPIGDWPGKYKEKFLPANNNATFKKMFGEFQRAISIEFPRLFNGRYLPYAHFVPFLEATDLDSSRRLLGIPDVAMLRKDLFQVIEDMSKEYSRLEMKLVDTTIIDLLSQTNMTGEDALKKSFGYLLSTLASTSLERLQHAKQYARILNRQFIKDIKNLTLSQVNEKMKQNTSANVFFYSFNDIINYYASNLNISDSRIKRLKLAKKYRDSKTISELYRMSGKSIDNKKSVISIAIDFLDISVEQLKLDQVSDKDIRLLTQMTIADFDWIFPNMDYKKSTLPVIQKHVISSVLATIFVKRLDSFSTTILSRKSLIDVIKTPSINDTQQMYEIIHNRTLASLNNKSMVNSKEFRQILTSQPLADYAASTKQSEASLYSLKTKDAITVIYQDISKCNGGSFCEDKDSNSTCQETTEYGHQCRCKLGFMNNNGILCMDINECKIPNICHAHAQCSNTVGSYTCKCKPGFSGNGTHCEDINECTQNACHTNCTNTVGSYRCDPCPESQSGNGTTCFDACSSQPCPKHTTCTNMKIGRECRCIPGRFMKMDGEGNTECALPTKIIKISGLKVNEQYNEGYSNLSARSTVKFVKKVEKAIFDFLKTIYTIIAGIQVTGLTKGSVNVEFVILFKAGNQSLPNNTQVGTTISNAVNNSELTTINAVPSQIQTEDKHICDLGADTCGIHGKCVPKDDDFTCNCNDGYKDEGGQCVKQEPTKEEDDKLALKVALPIVIILLLILFIVGVVCIRKKKNQGGGRSTSRSYKNDAYSG